MKKKISFLISSISSGGSENVCINIANGLAKRGWNIDLICFDLKEKRSLKKISKNINFINLDSHSSIMIFIKIFLYIRKKNIRHIFCFHYLIASQLVILKFILNKKFKIIARNNISLSKTEENNYKEGFKKKIIFSLVKFLYPKVEFCISQCKDMKLDLINNYKFDRKKVKVIFNPVKYEIEKKSKNYKTKKDNVILLVGRLVKQKRHDIAIRLFSNILKKFSKYKLIIAGIGVQEKSLKKLVLKYGITNNVKFLGYKDNLSSLYKKAKVTILTSDYEGFPNTLIESITIGTPVVSFDCPFGPREIIKNDINGFLIKNHDEKNFEKKIIQALISKWDIKKIHRTASAYKNDLILDKYENFLYKTIKN